MIRVDVVFVAVVIRVVLFRPAGISVLLRQPVFVLAPLDGNGTFLDERILFPFVALARNLDKRGIYHLAVTGIITMAGKLFVKSCKQFVYQVERFALLAE